MSFDRFSAWLHADANLRVKNKHPIIFPRDESFYGFRRITVYNLLAWDVDPARLDRLVCYILHVQHEFPRSLLQYTILETLTLYFAARDGLLNEYQHWFLRKWSLASMFSSLVANEGGPFASPIFSNLLFCNFVSTIFRTAPPARVFAQILMGAFKCCMCMKQVKYSM